MSKATFYEHFANKEECILALFELRHAGRAGGDGQRRRTAPAATRASG